MSFRLGYISITRSFFPSLLKIPPSSLFKSMQHVCHTSPRILARTEGVVLFAGTLLPNQRHPPLRMYLATNLEKHRWFFPVFFPFFRALLFVRNNQMEARSACGRLLLTAKNTCLKPPTSAPAWTAVSQRASAEANSKGLYTLTTLRQKKCKFKVPTLVLLLYNFTCSNTPGCATTPLCSFQGHVLRWVRLLRFLLPEHKCSSFAREIN